MFKYYWVISYIYTSMKLFVVILFQPSFQLVKVLFDISVSPRECTVSFDMMAAMVPMRTMMKSSLAAS